MAKKITKLEIVKLYLNDYDRRLYLREMAKLLNKPHQSIKPYLDSLTKSQVLKQFRRRKITEYTLNWKNKLIAYHLTQAEIQRTIDFISQNTSIRILAEKLRDHFEYKTFIIFGSAAQSLAKAKDIDLLTVGKGKSIPQLGEFESVYSKKIHLVQVSSFNALSKSLLNEVYKKHVIFNCFEQTVSYFIKCFGRRVL